MEKLPFLSIILIVFALVISSKAADEECEIYPPDVTVYFPHEYNCSLYYECYNGNKTLNECEDGLYFYPKMESCDVPALTGCQNRDARCVNVDMDYFSIDGNCTEYIECLHGDSYSRTCPEGLFFDSIEKRCTLPSVSDCVPPPSPPWTTPNPLCFGVRPNEVRPASYDKNCHQYWMCQGAHLSLQSCPSDLLFNNERTMCDFPDLVQCDGTTETPNSSTASTSPSFSTPSKGDSRCSTGEVSYWTYATACHMYIECYNGMTYIMDCPIGLFFSETYGSCVQPSLAECTHTTIPTTARTTTPMSTGPTNWTPDPECWYDGWLLPSTGDCTQYYKCAKGTKIATLCPDGLWFNYGAQGCDYPYQSGCRQENLSID